MRLNTRREGGRASLNTKNKSRLKTSQSRLTKRTAKQKGSRTECPHITRIFTPNAQRGARIIHSDQIFARNNTLKAVDTPLEGFRGSARLSCTPMTAFDHKLSFSQYKIRSNCSAQPIRRLSWSRDTHLNALRIVGLLAMFTSMCVKWT